MGDAPTISGRSFFARSLLDFLLRDRLTPRDLRVLPLAGGVPGEPDPGLLPVARGDVGLERHRGLTGNGHRPAPGPAPPDLMRLPLLPPKQLDPIQRGDRPVGDLR